MDQKEQPKPIAKGGEVYSLLDVYLKNTIGENNDYVRKKLKERYEFGKQKYGVSLHTDNGRDSQRDLEEEMLDAIYYLISNLYSKKDISNFKLLLQTLNDMVKNSSK